MKNYEVMKEAEGGATIQVRQTGMNWQGKWEDTKIPLWNWLANEYRVKPSLEGLDFMEEGSWILVLDAGGEWVERVFHHFDDELNLVVTLDNGKFEHWFSFKTNPYAITDIKWIPIALFDGSYANYENVMWIFKNEKGALRLECSWNQDMLRDQTHYGIIKL